MKIKYHIKMSSTNGNKMKPHAICIPYPALGHISPMLKLAKLLHQKGFFITFVNTEYNHRCFLKSHGPTSLDGLPDFRFATIPDGLPSSDAEATQDILSLCIYTTTACLEPFCELIPNINSSGGVDVPPVSCIVSDGVMSFTLKAAERFGLPEVLFWTTSACGLLAYTQYKYLVEKRYVPHKVISCNKLRNTEWFSRQDPYVCLEYASTKFRTRTCTDGGKDPSFQEKFTFSLIEGLRDLSVVVWNSNTLANDDFIGKGKIHLQKVLSTGYDDSSWSLQDDKGRNGGYVQLIMHYPTANNLITPPPLLYTVVQAPTPQVPHYYAPPPSVTVPYPPISYPTPPSYPPSHPLLHPAGYPPPPQYSNEPTIYLPTNPPSVTYPPTYPLYPPPHLSYLQLPQDTRYYSQGSYYPQPPN